MKALVFEAQKTGYGIDQIEDAMTVAELREMLEELEDDMMVIISHDRGYTYGTLPRYADIREERDGEYGTEYESIDEVFA